MAQVFLRSVSLNIPLTSHKSNSLKGTMSSIFLKKISKLSSSGKNVGGIIKNFNNSSHVNVLDDVNIKLNDGDSLGIIGHNGSGKSSLLKLIAGIYKPTNGSVEVNGSIFPIFSTFIGMDMDLTGIENIELRCKIMGKNKFESQKIKKNVIDFCDLGDFIYLPLRTYSSGMKVRLSFGLSTSIQSDILLIDENLDAGDITFRKKSSERAETFLKKSKIIVLVSHNLETVKSFCKKCLILHKGKILDFGETKTIIQTYSLLNR
tara:strand:- start:380 stop:1165 length:786 start_codon:yes stop_codon:yes gene_type:complete